VSRGQRLRGGGCCEDRTVRRLHGEHAVIDIDRIGRLEFNVRDPLQRRWPKESDEVSAKDVREGTGGPGRRTRPLE
jgi:hypothetical protein